MESYYLFLIFSNCSLPMCFCHIESHLPWFFKRSILIINLLIFVNERYLNPYCFFLFFFFNHQTNFVTPSHSPNIYNFVRLINNNYEINILIIITPTRSTNNMGTFIKTLFQWLLSQNLISND